MKNADFASKSIEDACQYWFGQFGAITIPNALSESVFCITLPIQEDAGKQ